VLRCVPLYQTTHPFLCICYSCLMIHGFNQAVSQEWGAACIWFDGQAWREVELADAEINHCELPDPGACTFSHPPSRLQIIWCVWCGFVGMFIPHGLAVTHQAFLLYVYLTMKICYVVVSLYLVWTISWKISLLSQLYLNHFYQCLAVIVSWKTSSTLLLNVTWLYISGHFELR